MTNLEQSFTDLCEKHGLLSLSITLIVIDDTATPYHFFDASMQWRDPSKEHGRGIATHNDETILGALRGAIERMAVKRSSELALADEPLPIGEAA